MNRYKFNYLEYSAAGIFFFLLFAPKINLIDFAGSGIRVDDFLLLIFLFILLPIIHNISTPSQLKIFNLFLITGIISIFFGVFYGRVQLFESLLYWIRNVQYLVYFLVGFYAAKIINLQRTLTLFAGFLVFLIVLEQFTGITLSDRFAGSGRFSGNTGGPYELAAICAFLIFYFIHYRVNLFYVAATFLMLVMTQSRITLAAVVIVLLLQHRKGRLWLILFACLALIIFAILMGDSGVAERILGLFKPETYESILGNSIIIPKFSDTASYRYWAFEDILNSVFSSEGDVSALIRFIRWTSLLASVQSCGVSCWLFGLGPSFGSSAVDGNIVRFIVEYGLIGSFLFFTGLWSVVSATQSDWLKRYFFVLLFTAFAIDIFVSLKAMALLWFACGYILKRKKIYPEFSKYHSTSINTELH